ncbi:MAG: response regulator [Nitrospirota bacterium]
MEETVKILCVDDEQNVINALKRLFLDENYTILTALSGQEGLNILEQEHTQLVISDYRMPGMNGVDFLKEVYKKLPDTVRIVLSGYADTAAIVSAINEGQIYKFIPKPWNDDELKVTVANAIERYFLHKKNRELTEELKVKNEELTTLNEMLNDLLDFKSRALATNQNILDAIPAAIIGIDSSNLIVLNNSAWTAISKNKWGLLGQPVEDNLPECVVRFVHEIREKRRAAAKTEINGAPGRLAGAVLDHGDDQKGIILMFIPEEEWS